MTGQTERELVQRDTAARLFRLQHLPEHRQKAALANLRRGVGRVPGELPELWGEFLLEFPPELESESGVPTKAELAVYLAVTLFALHQQGRDPGREPMHRDGQSLGRAVRLLVKPGEDPQDAPVLRRFQALTSAASMQEAAQHLRGMIQLLRSGGIPLDYVGLASDLYDVQFQPSWQRVRLRWGQDYYRAPADDGQTNDQTKEGEGKQE